MTLETKPMNLIGDGDTRHIGFKVEMPGAYEIASVSNFSITDLCGSVYMLQTNWLGFELF